MQTQNETVTFANFEWGKALVLQWKALVRIIMAKQGIAKLDKESSGTQARHGTEPAATMSCGIEVLKLNEELPEMLGLKTLAAFLNKHEDFEELLKKAQKDYKGDQSNLPEPIAKLFNCIAGREDNSDDLGKALAKLADGASRLLAFAITTSEVRAIITKQNAWSKA
eukprot:1558523-Amphidinium_carterae.1